jgi:hypothetical protein
MRRIQSLALEAALHLRQATGLLRILELLQDQHGSLYIVIQRGETVALLQIRQEQRYSVVLYVWQWAFPSCGRIVQERVVELSLYLAALHLAVGCILSVSEGLYYRGPRIHCSQPFGNAFKWASQLAKGFGGADICTKVVEGGNERKPPRGRRCDSPAVKGQKEGA